jgi:hypothetical protein
MPHRPSSRARTWSRCGRPPPSSSTNALMPGRSRVYVGTSVPADAAISRRGRPRQIPSASRLRAGSCIRCLLALLLLGEADVEVEVEVAAERGRPGKRPPIRRLYACSFASGARDTAAERDVVLARCTRSRRSRPRSRSRTGTRRVVGPEHEVVDEELRAPSEEVLQRGAPLVGLESVLLVDRPTAAPAAARQLVALPRVLLLRREQLESGLEPLLARSGLVLRHLDFLLVRSPSGSRRARARCPSPRS